jgi:ComEC/Rec2-related protein
VLVLKRPLAVIGFSMLITFLVVTNITHKMAIALLTGAVVIFLLLLAFKKLRKQLSVIFALSGVILFTCFFVSAEKHYLNEMKEFENEQTLTGVVCQIPTDSDYAFSYVIKPDGKNYKIRFVTESNAFVREGDYVKMSLADYDEYEEIDMFEHSLSSKIYFTFFESDKCKIQKTGETNLYYQKIGVLKRDFSEIVMNYLPGENGVLATAMTIGEIEEIDDRTIDYFNYSGTSHLLVISGLHLSLWSFGIMEYINKFSRIRRFSHLIGLLCLFAFASITGFSVSVIRAGAMVAFVLVARFFNRDADNLNSIGAAVTFILIENPFAPFSVSLWLTVLSTVGMIVFASKMGSWLEEKLNNKPISKMPFYSALLTAIAISFSVSVFTLPVFIYRLKMMPILSIFSNFIMVTPAMFMMVSTVLGVIGHICYLFPLSRICFFIAGAVGQLMTFTAEKIGMLDCSTISLNHRYYKYFFVLLIAGVVIVFVLKKYKIDILKHMSVFLTLVFCIVAVYCTVYEYNTPSVEVLFTSEKPVITVFSEGKSALIGVQKKKYAMTIKDMLRKHNEKQLDNIIVTENKSATVSQLIYLYKNFGKGYTHYKNEAHGIFKENSTSFATNLALSGKVNIDFSDTDLVEINTGDKSILLVDCKKIENIYENLKNYDIIFLYGKNPYEFEEILKQRFESSQIIVSAEGKMVSIS